MSAQPVPPPKRIFKPWKERHRGGYRQPPWRIGAERLRRWRHILGLSQTELEIATGSTVGRVGQWERGEVAPVPISRRMLEGYFRLPDVRRILEQEVGVDEVREVLGPR